MFCTKCGFSGPIERPTEKAVICQKCGYCAFAQECDYNDEEVLAFARSVAAVAAHPPEGAQPEPLIYSEKDAAALCEIAVAAYKRGVELQARALCDLDTLPPSKPRLDLPGW